MELKSVQAVAATPDEVGALLEDLTRIASCWPGMIVERTQQGTCAGTVELRAGPVALRYSGTLSVQAGMQQHGRIVLRAQGKDESGGGEASATIEVLVSAAPEGAWLELHAHADLGPAQDRFGRSVLSEAMQQTLDGLAANVAAAVVCNGAADREGASGASGASGAMPRAFHTGLMGTAALLGLLVGLAMGRLRWRRTSQ